MSKSERSKQALQQQLVTFSALSKIWYSTVNVRKSFKIPLFTVKELQWTLSLELVFTTGVFSVELTSMNLLKERFFGLVFHLLL